MKSSRYFIQYIVITLLLLSGCAKNPVTGEREVMLISEEQEKQMGAQNDPAVVAQFGLYDNPQMQRFIDQKGEKMVGISHRPEMDFTFRILDSEVVNAFALPGGYVYFTRGILAHFNNEAELAGVLGHEIGHVTARHSASQMSKQTLLQGLFIGGMILSPEFAQFGDVAAQGLQLLFLKHSRDDESQSDKLGVEYSTKIGYDSYQMADFFKTIQRLQRESGANEIPTFLTTHPDPANRFENVREMTTEWQRKVPESEFAVNRENYLDMIDGIVVGVNPRQGFFEQNTFYHPDLKFQFPVPARWQTANMPTQVQMAPTDGKALIAFTLSNANTPEAALEKAASDLNLRVLSSSRTEVNGHSAARMISELQQQNQQTGAVQTLKVQTYAIRHMDNTYLIHGVSDASVFNRYQSDFNRTQTGFETLTDREKLNRQPDKLDIITLRTPQTLKAALTANNVPTNRLEEFAIMNGMELNKRLESGRQIKALERNPTQ